MKTAPYPPTTWGRYHLTWGMQTWIMGIINVTPDSFAGDGLAIAPASEVWIEHAVAQARRQVAEGAHIIDVGGASSRPGADPIALESEMERVVPTIKALAEDLPAHIPISVDTTSAAVARAALEAGAAMINDISGLHAEPELATVAARAGVPVVIMANMRGVARHESIADATRYLARGIEIALVTGIPWEHIIIDPGFGFGNTPAQNLALIRHLDAFQALGRPILLGVSRKSTLGHVLGDLPVEERLEASLAAAVVGIMQGAAIVRVHDVQATARAVRIVDAIMHEA